MKTQSGPLIAIGDIHGCVHALETLLAESAFTMDDLIVCLGIHGPVTAAAHNRG